jgi:hypothetical protein
MRGDDFEGPTGEEDDDAFLDEVHYYYHDLRPIAV